MARAVLLLAGLAWIVAGLAAAAVASVGIDVLVGLLPPLAIESGALARTVLALGIAACAIGAAHLVVGLGIGRDRAWAVNAGILLSGVATMLGIALGAAALTSAVAGTMQFLAALAAAIGSALVALAYTAAGAALVLRLRAGGLR